MPPRSDHSLDQNINCFLNDHSLCIVYVLVTYVYKLYMAYG